MGHAALAVFTFLSILSITIFASELHFPLVWELGVNFRDQHLWVPPPKPTSQTSRSVIVVSIAGQVDFVKVTDDEVAHDFSDKDTGFEADSSTESNPVFEENFAGAGENVVRTVIYQIGHLWDTWCTIKKLRPLLTVAFPKAPFRPLSVWSSPRRWRPAQPASRRTIWGCHWFLLGRWSSCTQRLSFWVSRRFNAVHEIQILTKIIS